MASSVSSNKLECSICCEDFKIPKILHCGHTFCLDCLQRYIGEKTVEFPCPVCGKMIRIPRGGVKKFTTNFIAHTTPSPTLESPVTGTSTSTPSTPQVTGNTNRPVTQIKHGCPTHGEREIEFYCQTCSVGVCSRCMYLNHNDHTSLDIDCENTKTKAIEEVSKFEKVIQQKIKDLETTLTTLQETSVKLKSMCDEECTKVTDYTEKIIKDLRENCEKTKTTIKQHYDESEMKLTENLEKIGNDIKNLKIDLENKLPSLTKDSCLTIVQSLPVIKQLGKISEDLTITLPDITYSIWTDSCDFKSINMGQLETKTYYMLNKLKPHDFIFSVDEIKGNNERNFSKNKYTVTGVVWSCVVYKSYHDVGIYIAILPSDNPSLESCDIDFIYKLINHRGMDSIEKDFAHRFTETSWNRGHRNFISWKTLIDKQNGFMTEDNKFIVQLDIKEVGDIKMKDCK